MDNVYKSTLIFRWLSKRLKNMSQKNDVMRQENCPITVESTVTLPKDSRKNVPSQTRKEDAELTLYLTRI
jgi:hypothetical protein